jgi:hypothetical protein
MLPFEYCVDIVVNKNVALILAEKLKMPLCDILR